MSEIKQIKHFVLPKLTDDLYKNEAISSISLTKEVANKINELVDGYNRVLKGNIEKDIEQDGRIRKAIIYMKDNLENTLSDMFEVMKYNGELDDIITESVAHEITELKELMVNVKDFGARGNGEGDDTAAFTEAIKMCKDGKILYIPKTEGTYKISKLTIDNIPNIKIEGIIQPSEYLEIKGDINSSERNNIDIYSVKGTLKLSGINTGKVKIVDCDTLELISTKRDEFIGYSTFDLGDVINLKLITTNKGWINENIFIGGRLTNVTFEGDLAPEDNLFIKPMFENSTINIKNGYRNRFTNCRFEGVNNINLSEGTYGNYFEKTFFTVPVMMYAKFQEYDINFNDLGDNILIRETGTKSYSLISLNKYNNPYNINVNEKGNLYPSSTWERLFISDLVELPNTNICLEFINPSKKVDFRLSFYDKNKNLLTETDSINSTQLIHNGNGDYSLSSPSVEKIMALIYPNKSAKYVKVTILGFGEQMEIDELEVRVSVKNDKLIQKFIDGFKNPVSQ